MTGISISIGAPCGAFDVLQVEVRADTLPAAAILGVSPDLRHAVFQSAPGVISFVFVRRQARPVQECVMANDTETPTTSDDVDELLVEEVSIDGMCGVY